jgi:hypothetical protein
LELVDWEFVDLPGLDEPPEPVDDGLAPHAATTRTTLAVVMMAARARPGAGRGRRWRPAPVLAATTMSSWLDGRAARRRRHRAPTTHDLGAVRSAGAVPGPGERPRAIAAAEKAPGMGIRFMLVVVGLAG